MKHFFVFSSFYIAVSWNLALASIDTNGELFSSHQSTAANALTVNMTSSEKTSGLFSADSGNAGVRVDVSPLAMNRDLSIMTHFSVLPQDYQMTVKQFLLGYVSDDRAEFNAEFLRSEKAEGQARSVSVDVSRPFLPVSSMSEAFVQVDASQNTSETSSESAPVTLGVRGQGSLGQSPFGKVEWRSEFAYEDYLAADVIGSPAFKAALCGKVSLNTRVPSEFNVNLLHAGKSSLEEELRYLDKKRTGNVFSPVVSNLSVLNTQLACNPRKNLFLSVDYYYYLQNELKVQAYSSPSSISEVALTNGESSALGEELNLKAIYAYSDACRSQLLAGWFDPGPAYGKTEDTKTFEIRGEIIVNF